MKTFKRTILGTQETPRTNTSIMKMLTPFAKEKLVL